MKRYLCPVVTIALAAIVFFPHSALADTPASESGYGFGERRPDGTIGVCGTPDISEDSDPPQGPSRFKPRSVAARPVSGDFLYQGFVDTGSGGTPTELPFSFTLHISDNAVTGTALLEGRGEMDVAGKVMPRGVELTLTDGNSVLRLTSSPIGKSIRGRIRDGATGENWSFEADRSRD